MIRRLHHLRNGQSGFVVAIAAAGERAQRLRDMGLLPGVGITVMGRSPMGDLLSLRVMGTTLALRVADAEDVAEVNPPFFGAVGVSNDFPRRFNGLSKAPLPERSSRYEL